MVDQKFFSPPVFEAKGEHRGALWRLGLSGELDLATVPAFEQALGRADARECGVVALDLSEVSFIDVAGARAVVSARDRFAAEGRALRIVGASAAACRIFELTGWSRYLDVQRASADRHGFRTLQAEFDEQLA
jgi:anti-anti-sigma factor